MWILGDGVQYAGQNDGLFVALIGLVAALEVLVVLVVRSVGARRRRHEPPSGYS